MTFTIDTGDSPNGKGIKKPSKKDPCPEDEWLCHAEKVTVDQYPPALDETPHRRVSNLPDGSHEVTYECEYCQQMFVTPAQLTGKLALLGTELEAKIMYSTIIAL